MDHRWTIEGSLRIDPPLTPRVRVWLRWLRAHPAGRSGQPAGEQPFEAAADGHQLQVTVPRAPALAEWVAYLAARLPPGHVAGGPTSTLTGRLDVIGEDPTDRWALLADTAGVRVRRERLPCPMCWARLRATVGPTLAYQFPHPEPLDSAHGQKLAALLRPGRPCPAFGWRTQRPELAIIPAARAA